MNTSPPCKGVSWSVTDDKCLQCLIKEECLAFYVMGVLKEAQIKFGPDTTIEELSFVLNTNTETIKAALKYQENIGASPFKSEVVEKELEPKKRTWEWGKEHDLERWKRERKRSKKIARLKPGMVLTKSWEGTDYELAVHKGGYFLNTDQVLYPTLYAATKAIVGTRDYGGRDLVPYSGVRFWGLDKFLKSRGLLPKPKRRRRKRSK